MRLNYYDFLRGIAILMVVAIHTGPIYHFDTIQGMAAVMMRQPLNSAVPIFFAISGYFLTSKKLETKSDVFAFWRHQIPKVYVPVLIWSIPYLLLYLYGGKELLKGLALYFICGYSVYYFIIVIVQCYLLSPLLIKAKSGGVKISILISMLSITLVTYIMQVRGVSLPLVVYAGHCDLWLMFFMMGIMIRRSGVRYSLRMLVLLAFLSLVWQFAESSYLCSFNGGGFGIKPSSFVFSTVIVLILFHPSIVNNYKEVSLGVIWVRKLGRISFGVYLIHCFFIQIFSYVGLKGLPWGLTWILVVSASAGTVLICRKTFPLSLNRYLGF